MDQLSSAGNQSQKHTEPTQGGGRRRNKWARLTAADCRPSTKAARRTPWNKLLCKWKEQQRLATQKSEQPITISKQIIVITDKNDYSPGEVVRITATGITPGGTALFSIADDASDPGADGNADDYGSFLVSDGSSEDLDREVNGKIVASWIVPTDNNGSGSGIPDALDATLRLTTQEVGAGSDGIFGTPDDINIGSSQVTSFTDGAAIITKTGVSITLDETTGLQNQATTPSSASDANDNDIASSSLPSALATRLSQLGVNPANLLGAALSGYTGTNTGLDSFTLSAAGGGLDLTFTDQSGLILNGRDSGLTTVDNNKIYLFTDSGSGSNNNLVLGRVGTSAENARNGAIAFAAYIEETPTGGKIWTIENSPLRHPNPQDSDEGINLANQLYLGSTTQDSNFSFSKAPSGQNLFLMLGSTGSQSGRKAGIVITGMNPADQSTGVSISKGDTVNTSQGGGGTTIGINNQMIDPKAANKPLEGTYITFVTDPVSNYTVPNLDQNEADLEKNIQFGGMLNTRAAAFTISQTQPAGKASTMRLTARFTADGSTPDGNGTTIEQGVNFIDTTKGGEKGGGLLDDKTVSITGVIVRNASGAVLNNAVADPSNHTKVFDANGVQIQFNYDTNGTVLSATITGVKTQYSIEYSTTGDHNRLLIENIGNSNANLNSSFDLGSFRVLQAGCVSPVEIGSQICFEDDAPSGTITIKPGVFLATDESAGANTLPTGYGSETAPAGTLGQQTVAFASLVNNGLTPGNDGLGSTSFTLTITEGANSGLKTPDGLQNIVLHLNGAVVEGRVQASTGALVFTLGIDAATGAATLTQFLAVQHTPNGGANDFTGGLAPGTVLLNATIVDKDGDSRTQSVDLGSVVRFVDDTPDAVNDSITQSQENQPVTINVFSNDSQGADGVNQLNAIALVPGSLNGTGSLVYNGDGTFTYTPFNGETGTVSFQYTITDQDGDLDTATASITLAADSTPTISVLDNSSPKPQPGLIDAVVSEGGLPNGNISGPITDSGSFEIGLGSDSLDTLKITAGSNTVDVTAGTGITVQGAYGILTVNLVNGIYTWSYTLTSTTTDITGQDETDSFIVTVTDNNGDTASDNLVVSILDDTPDAVNDSITQSQENQPVTINVFSNDSQGADGVNQLNAIALVPGSLNGTGSLVYNGDGTFTYTPFNGETGTVSFQYTITDQDGDLDTATASITLAADSTPTISVLDNSSPKPQPGLIDAVVSEGGLPNGNISGPITDSGSFEIGLGSDSLDTLKITAGSNTVDVTAGTGITVQGAYGILTVNLVNGIYTWSYTLTSTTTDITGQDETDSFIVTVTDNNGDTASDNLVVNILDDTPDVTLTDTNGSPKLMVDESDFNTDASGNFAAEFTSTKQYGADGLGAFSTLYSLGINPGGTNLIDTASNEAVILTINGGIVEGRTAGSDALVFTITVDTNGLITLDQKRALKHPNSSANNESITLSSADLVTLTRADTITDSDGDTNIATATINIGQDLLFLDDAPAGTITLKSGAILATDESAGANPLPGGFGSETAPAGTLGQQTIAYTSLINDSLTPGNDGLGSKSFSLAITEGANTALKTADGLPIVLHLNGSVVEGRVQTTTGALAFTLAVDAVTGAATLTQYLAAQHSPNGGADDIAGGLTAGTVLLNTAIIDKDGDSRTQSVDLGSVVRFIDDAPSLHSFAGNQNVIIDAPYTTSSTPVIYSGINIGSWSVGSDGLAASTPFTISGLPAGYTPTTPVINGSTVTFSILYQGIKVADFELNAAAANDDTLKIYQIPGTIVEGTIDGSAATAGGPGTYYVELPTADVVAVVSGKNPDGTEGTVNASNQGWAGGDGDQNMEDGETITFTFQDYDKNEPNNTGGPDFVTAFSFDAQKFTGNGNNPTLQITVVYADGTTTKQFSPVSIPNGVTSYPFTINQFGLSAGGTLVQDFANSSGIRAVTILDVVDGSQTFNINGVKISGYSETRPDLNPNFNLTITDRDGDSSTLSVKLNLDGNDTGTNDPTVLKITAAPIVLDMSGNGIQYTDLGLPEKDRSRFANAQPGHQAS
jgi:YD repeat-containing protein